ncbi:MAG TPA: phosphoenolpyruvate--protein phosphotransferase [Desulfuromonadales bacterium]|nr:phosphoenolpyruvate--protein phosphotransferase [Desulfuromonadales bacterium]
MALERNDRMQVFTGIAASPGIAVGRLRVIDRRRVSVTEYPVAPESVSHEIGRLSRAISDTRLELVELHSRLAESSGHEHLFIIETHLMILDDQRLTTEASEIISGSLINAEGALRRSLHRYRDMFAGIDDPYLQERISDFEMVIERVLRTISGTPVEQVPHDGSMVVLAAHELSPADILQLNRANVLAVVTETGGSTSHAAILARAFELTAVAGAEGIADIRLDSLPVIVDGISGTVYLNPDQEVFQLLLARKQQYEYVESELLKTAALPAVTPDGYTLVLRGNVEIPEEGASLLKYGGCGVGLYRTEMLFMNRRDMPGEEEQYQAYRAMLQAVVPHLLTIRTLDAGGDKLLDGMEHPTEANPALGMRAIRLSLGMPEEFKKQLRAILRVGAEGAVRVMFPMISGIEELRTAMNLLEEAKSELAADGVPFDNALQVGVMIEIPSVVTLADLLAREVDFFSVGTNDLIQYTLAIDRGNEQLSPLYQPLHPAVLRSLKRIVEEAHGAGIPACLCGEMAGDPRYLPVLLGLGFDELSMGAASILKVKQALRGCSRATPA